MSVVSIGKVIGGFPHHAVSKNGLATILCVTMAYRNRAAPVTCKLRLVVMTFDYI